jgi:hypothetical protein
MSFLLLGPRESCPPGEGHLRAALRASVHRFTRNGRTRAWGLGNAHRRKTTLIGTGPVMC